MFGERVAGGESGRGPGLVRESELGGAAVMELLVARARQVAQGQAELLAGLVAVADAVPVAEFAPMEIASALTWTRQMATFQLGLACTIVRQLPMIHDALAAGQIDLAKAKVIADGVSCLANTQARAVAEKILPIASGLTTGQLRARLSKLVIEVDPEAAAVRHRERIKDRRVVLEPTGDSCASVFGLDLPADRAAVVTARLSELTRAAKRAGDRRSMDQLRADFFLDLLCGSSAPSGGGVELVASLETLTRLAAHPGDLAGYGPVVADIARQVAEQQKAGRWSFRIHDEQSGEVVRSDLPSAWWSFRLGHRWRSGRQ